MNTQIANTLDPITQEKIVKGFFIALSGGIAVGLVAWLLGLDAAKALLLMVLSTFVPTGVNGRMEYLKGE